MQTQHLTVLRCGLRSWLIRKHFAILTAYRHLLPDSVALSQFIVHLGLVLLLGICILLTLACKDILLLD